MGSKVFYCLFAFEGPTFRFQCNISVVKKVINLEVKCLKNVWWILQRASTTGYLRIVRTVATY